MNENQPVGESYMQAFAGQGSHVGVVEPTTTRAKKAAPLTLGGVRVITIRDVKPVTDGVVESVAVMFSVDGPDAEAKRKLAEAWVPAANKYEKWFRATPEIAALLGTVVCMAPMYKQYNTRVKAEKAAEPDAPENGGGLEAAEIVKEPDF